jgi:uncharacterized protein (TIGR02246 family)
MMVGCLMACSPTATEKAATGDVATVDVAAVRQEIESANARGIDAFNKGDVEGFAANYAADAVVMMPNEPAFRGGEAIRAGMKRFLEAGTVSGFNFRTEDVQVGGDLAVETGTFEWTFTPKGGKPAADKGKYLTVWRKQADGSWKIVRDINNSDLPVAPPSK